MSSQLHLGPTSTAQWLALIKDAQQLYGGQPLAEDVENYVVLLLHYFINKPDLAESVLATEFLASQKTGRAQQLIQLRTVGDTCLLFSGLFPEFALHKHVSVSYFVGLGQQAYYQLSLLDHSALAKLFHDLEIQFVILMDILQCMRELSGEKSSLSPILAEELYWQTQSKHALAIFKRFTKGMPIRTESKKKH